ncbi:2TM domain-containing protein [uncultured Dokdonia sp.]|uniref:2TM domain-containing protein n=1 Tax=uncultured Dokdonia sp. TaxID=575653 RepID=UPI0026037EEA|nr:2TM domain-containing protein [uncultured Dokdonia sp.]
MEDQENKYERARKRVAQLKRFYGKLGGFLLFGLLFLGFNYYSNGLRYPWFLWIVGFWGLGVGIEAFKLFGTDLFLGKNWEQRKIKEQMEKENRESSTWF